MLKTFKFRIYPNKIQREKIDWTIEECRKLYNNWLAERKDNWEINKLRITKRIQQNSIPNLRKDKHELTEIYGQTIQDVVDRVEVSFQNFFRKIKAEEKSGYPRFKAIDRRYHSFTYPQFPGHGLK